MTNNIFNLTTLWTYSPLKKLEGEPTDKELKYADVIMRWEEEQYALARRALINIRPSKRLVKVLRLWKRADTGDVVLALLVFDGATLERHPNLLPHDGNTK